VHGNTLALNGQQFLEKEERVWLFPLLQRLDLSPRTTTLATRV